MDNLTIETLLKLMNEHGATSLKINGTQVEITVPNPRQSISKSLQTISTKELKSMKKQPKTDDDLLFFHENFDETLP